MPAPWVSHPYPALPSILLWAPPQPFCHQPPLVLTLLSFTSASAEVCLQGAAILHSCPHLFFALQSHSMPCLHASACVYSLTLPVRRVSAIPVVCAPCPLGSLLLWAHPGSAHPLPSTAKRSPLGPYLQFCPSPPPRLVTLMGENTSPALLGSYSSLPGIRGCPDHLASTPASHVAADPSRLLSTNCGPASC